MLAYAHPGQKAVEGAGNIRGHGTNLVGGELVATVSGLVVRTNKLVSVRPVNSRYGGHVGDVVVGRVLEVRDAGWKVDINDKFDATLLVNSLFVPGSFAMRKSVIDALQILKVFKEGDLISAEIQKINIDNSINLQTRSAKYGKLENGFIVKAPHILVRKMNTHFVTLASSEVSLIVGVNGNIWVACEAAPQSSAEERRAAFLRSVRVGNSIEVLKANSVEIHDRAIAEVYDRSLRLGLGPYEMLAREYAERLLVGED